MISEREAIFEGINPRWYQFYSGTIVYGILSKNHENNRWYLIPITDYPKKGSITGREAEFGKEVDLKSLSYCSLEPERMETYDSNVTYHRSLKVILVILGAGASYDVSGQTGFSLPTTNNLFSVEHKDHWKHFDGVKALYSDLHKVNNLETFFENQWKKLESKYNPNLLSELINVQFYLQYFFLKKSIEGKEELPNYYRSLIRQMRDYVNTHSGDYKFVVVNFNYDTLFEEALTTEMGYSFNSVEEYDEFSREILVFKPHGSSNWCRYVKAEFQNEFSAVRQKDPMFFAAQASEVYERKLDMAYFSHILENRISIMNDEVNHFIKTHRLTNMITDLASNRVFFPHLLIPFSSKDEYVMPESQFSRLGQLLNYAERLYIYGWKGGEAKFLELLNRNLPKKQIHVHGFTTKNGHTEIISNLGPHIAQCEFNNSFLEGFAKGIDLVNELGENMFSENIDFSKGKKLIK